MRRVVIAVRVVAGVLLLAHGLVHLLYLAPGVPEFSIDRSWLLAASVRQPYIGLFLSTTLLLRVVLEILRPQGRPPHLSKAGREL